jgi:outer membrane protein assembly factor BamB
MSPEQVEGLECGPPSDVFSLGSVLAYAACGAAPFNGGPSRSSASVMYRVVHAEPDLVSVPESVRQLVAACLAKDPGRRPDLGQVAAHCAAMADYLGLPATAFWPPEVAQVIQAAQASLTADLQELQSAPVAPAQWAGPGAAGMGAAGMVTPARSAVMTPPAGPAGAGGWDRMPAPGIAWDGRTGGTSRPGMSRRGLLVGAGVAGAAVVGGTAWWALASRLPGTHAAGYQSPQTGAPGTGSGAAGSSAGQGGSTGASAAGPGSPQLAWTFTTGNAVEANPGVGNGVVYVGSRDNYVYAIDIATGKQAWKCLVGWVTAAPELVGDMVCAATTTGGFYAIHASSGVVAWQLTTDVPAAFKPNFAAAGGTVYLPSATKPLQAYDAATGGSVMTFGSLDQYTGAVAVAGGLLFAVDQSGTLHALRAATGATVWNASVIGSGDAPGTGLVVGGGAVYLGSSSGTLYSVNASNGTPNWSYQTGGTLISNPAVADGIVYVCDADGNVHAVLAQTGKQAWSRPAGAGGESGPAVAGGQVYVSTGLALQAYGAKSGDPAWSYTPPNTGGLVSTPAVADGLIFIGSSNDNLYALKA